MKTRMTGLMMLSLLMLVIGSCSLLPGTPSAVHDFAYPYSNTPPETTALLQQSPVTVEAPNWLIDNRIRYRLLYATPTQVRFYSLDRWIAPPSELFEQLLNNNGKLWPTSVNIRLQVFEQQFDAPNQAKVAIHFTAIAMPDDNKHQAHKRDFRLQLPCTTPDAKGAVTSFNMLTRQAVDKIQVWLMESN